MHHPESNLQSFECTEQAIAPGTAAAPRPPDRPRLIDETSAVCEPSLQSFDCEAVQLASDTLAAPRPAGRPRIDPNLAES
jgi:hypothetical protein